MSATPWMPASEQVAIVLHNAGSFGLAWIFLSSNADEALIVRKVNCSLPDPGTANNRGE